MLWRKKPAEVSQPFKQEFGLEAAHLRLDDGSLFSPLAEATERWVVKIPSSYSIVPPMYRILYQTASGYVLLQTPPCETDVRDGRQLLVSDRPPNGRRLQQREAAAFLMNHQFPSIPDCLLEGLRADSFPDDEVAENGIDESPEPEPEIRPASYWQQQWGSDALVVRGSAHDVDVVEQLEHVVAAGVKIVQGLRDSGGSVQQQISAAAHDLHTRLFARFKVDPEHWDWESDRVPPADVDLLEIEWPASVGDAREAMTEIRRLVEPELGVLAYIRFAEVIYREKPTEAEERAATRSLAEQLPVIETQLARLRKIISEVARSDEESFGQPRIRDEERDHLVGQLERRNQLAYRSYEYAERKLGLVDPDRTGFTDQEVYAYLKDNSPGDYTPPAFESWARYVRDARKSLGEQKNQARKGRTGRSIRKADESD